MPRDVRLETPGPTPMLLADPRTQRRQMRWQRPLRRLRLVKKRAWQRSRQRQLHRVPMQAMQRRRPPSKHLRIFRRQRTQPVLRPLVLRLRLHRRLPTQRPTLTQLVEPPPPPKRTKRRHWLNWLQLPRTLRERRLKPRLNWWRRREVLRMPSGLGQVSKRLCLEKSWPRRRQ